MTAPDAARSPAERRLAEAQMRAEIRRIVEGDAPDKVTAICDLIAGEIAQAVADRVLAMLSGQYDADVDPGAGR